jgi:hypothetical protein
VGYFSASAGGGEELKPPSENLLCRNLYSKNFDIEKRPCRNGTYRTPTM